MRPALVLRPQPGNDRTAARLRNLGFRVHQLPLFEARALPWPVPKSGAFDALLLTSAQAVRLAGPGLEALASLPVVAVGEPTAASAHAAGLDVHVVGAGDVMAAVAEARAAGFARLLHLAGRDRMPGTAGVTAVPVYAAEPVDVAVRTLNDLLHPPPPGGGGRRSRPEGEETPTFERSAPADPRSAGHLPLAGEDLGAVALLHSARAARRFGELLDRDGIDRHALRLAALSPAILAAAGTGWAMAVAADRPDDAALCRLAAALARD